MMTFSARGIVAAATAPVFGLALASRGVKGADEIVPAVFMVIAGTVLISSILSPLVAHRFGLSGKSDPSMLMIGAPQWAVALGKTLKKHGTEVRFWTSNPEDIARVRKAGLAVTSEPINPQDPERLTGLNGVSLIGIATTSSDYVRNQLYAYNLSAVLEPDQVYRVADPKGELEVVANASRIIRASVPMEEIESRVEKGAEFAVFDSDESIPKGAVPLVVIETSKTLKRSEVYFLCDRPKSPRRRTRHVAALLPAGSASA